MKLVRLYGCFTGHGSFATVTSGWREALEDHGLLHDCFSMRTPMGSLPDGERVPVALVADVNELAAALGSSHSEVYLVLALHSAWVPPNLVPMLLDERVTILAPSQDTFNLLPGALKGLQYKAAVLPHGVDKGFEPLTCEQSQSLEKTTLFSQLRHPDPKCSNFLHTCESSTLRKSTYTLLRAFDRVCESKEFNASLTIVPSAMEHGSIHAVASALKCKDRVRVLPRLNAAPEKLKWVYACFDAIVQPSRAEGFGLVPLEGLVMGTPCAVTDRTGHTQWLFTRSHVEHGQWLSVTDRAIPGTVVVRADDPGPPLFEPAPAPVVTESSIRDALEVLRYSEVDLKEAAVANAPALREKYRWPLVVAPWAEAIKARYA